MNMQLSLPRRALLAKVVHYLNQRNVSATLRELRNSSEAMQSTQTCVRRSVSDVATATIEVSQETIPGSSSSRGVDRQLDMNLTTVWEIFRQVILWYTYKINCLHELKRGDCDKRLIFALSFLTRIEVDDSFPWQILWEDETRFHLNASFKIQNCRIWTTEQPNAVDETPMHSHKVTIRCGITAKFITGPFFSETVIPIGPITCTINEQRKDLIDELKIFGMSSRHHIDDFMRDRIIGKIEEGRKITDVARGVDIAHSVVSRLWKSFKTTGMWSRRHGGGRVRSTMPAEDRYIILSAKRNRRTTAQQHRTARLQWCREHHNWTEQDWACVLFSDESRFSLSSDCRCQLIWRESGTAYCPENIQEKDRYPTCSIMVWAGIMINGRTRLHVVANGTMTGQRYIDEVLLPHVRLFRGAVGDKFVFMDDNAICHRILAVQDCLYSEGIQRLVWPTRSPDLNPIENVWDALGRQVAGRNYPPTNKNTLIRALTEEWDKLPQQLLDNVVQSMVRRVECCIPLHGGHIPY
ncbi:transposable element Tcb2 transposase [Trichonephila clavipes]|nr:transposable element Tcb2 transposase [Trichonephila clavipes]